MKRVVSVWLADWPIAVWLKPGAGQPRTPPPEGAPFALVGRGPHGLTLSALNAAARAKGLHLGQAHADACAMVPDLVSAPAEPEQDLAALRRLALWAERFSPFVAVDTHTPGLEGLFIDITGGAHLFGGEAALLVELEARLSRAGVTAKAAVADAPAAAWALARFSEDSIAAPGRTREALAPLPVEALRLEPQAVVLLRRFGLKRIGDLYGLPRSGLARRFRGQAGFRVVERLDQALAILPEPLEPVRPAPLYRIWTPFAEPVTEAEGVAHCLPRLARALAEQLSRDAKGARRLVLTGFRVDGRATAIEAALSAPAASEAHMVRLLKEKGLERLDLGFGIDALMLSAVKAEAMNSKSPLLPLREKVAPEGGRMRGPSAFQAPLAGAEPPITPHPSASPPPSPARGEGDLPALMDRIEAKLGDGALRRPALRESWVPERSEAWVKAEPAPPPVPERDDAALRPILLLDPPEPVETLADTPDAPPVRFTWRRAMRRVVKADGPERLSAEWWRLDEDAKAERTRDYYRVEDDQGRRYWLYREGLYGREDESAPPRWWLHGVFA
jgi:protein ImuB